jgi:hypothetical protein
MSEPPHIAKFNSTLQTISKHAPKVSAHMRSLHHKLCNHHWEAHQNTSSWQIFRYKGIIPECKSDYEHLSRRTIAAFGNSEYWFAQRAYEYARTEETRNLLRRYAENNCFQNRISKLGKDLDCVPTSEDYTKVESSLKGIHRLSSDECSAGIFSVTFCAIFETTLVMTIGELKMRSFKMDVSLSRYRPLHMQIDPDFSVKLSSAVDREMNMGYSLPDTKVGEAFKAAGSLFKAIWT